MSQQELLKKVINVLNSAKIGYMVTGSVVSSLQGEPRSTHDIDLVVDIHPPVVRSLTLAFQMPDYYLDKDMMQEAIKLHSMFNLIGVNSGDKVDDFWVLTNEPYTEEFMGTAFQVQHQRIRF